MCRRFWEKVDRRGPDECWEWTGSRVRGYGQYFIKGRGPARAHRVSYEMLNGSLSDEMVIAHTCDNPACVNPNHLFACTQADNLSDMRAKDRDKLPPVKLGEANARSVLNADLVRKIRTDTRSQRKIASEYGISPATVAQVKSGRTWRHVT